MDKSYKLRLRDFIPLVGPGRYGTRAAKGRGNINDLDEGNQYDREFVKRALLLGFYNGALIASVALPTLMGLEHLLRK